MRSITHADSKRSFLGRPKLVLNEDVINLARPFIAATVTFLISAMVIFSVKISTELMRYNELVDKIQQSTFLN